MVNESADGMRLSRISKLFVDRDGMMVPEALLRNVLQFWLAAAGSLKRS